MQVRADLFVVLVMFVAAMTLFAPSQNVCAELPDGIVEVARIEVGPAHRSFGKLLAMDGHRLAASATRIADNVGLVFIFEKGSSGWEETARLEPPDWWAEQGNFSLHGDTLAIGNWWSDDNSGAVLVYELQPDGSWTLEHRITPPNSERPPGFGQTIVFEGDLMGVSAIGDDSLCPDEENCNSGAVFIFGRNRGGPGEWGLIRKLVPEGRTEGEARFGSTTAIGPGVLFATTRRAFQQQRLWVAEVENGEWAAPEPLTEWGDFVESVFGLSVDGDSLVAVFYNGSFSEFLRTETGWEPGGLVEAEVFPNGNFRSISLQADLLFIGDQHMNDLRGAVFLFERSQQATHGWVQAGKIAPEDLAEDSSFGYQLALQGTTLAVSAIEARDNPGHGHVRVFDIAGLDQPQPSLAVATVARVQGSGAVFNTRWDLFNGGDWPLDLDLLYTPRRDVGGDPLTAGLQLAPGELRVVDDPLSELFDIDGLSAGSVIVEANEGSVGDLVLQGVVSATLDDGRQFGQFFPAIPDDQALTEGSTSYLFTTESADHTRVNVGLMGLDDGTRVTLTPVNPVGDALADGQNINLDRGDNLQRNNIHQIFDLDGQDDVVMEVRVNAGRAVAYASAVDGVGAAYPGTSDPTTVLPVQTGTNYITLLEIGPVQGLNEFSGSGSLANLGDQPITVDATFRERGANGAVVQETITLAGGEVRGYENLVLELFGLESAVGTVTFEADRPTLAAIGRECAIYRDGEGEITGTAGQLMAGLSPDDLLLAGVRYHLIGLRSRDTDLGPERSHIALFNPKSESVRIHVELFHSGETDPVGSKTFNVGGETLKHVNNILTVVDPGYGGEPARLVVSADGPIHALAFRVNGNGDPVTITPARSR